MFICGIHTESPPIIAFFRMLKKTMNRFLARIRENKGARYIL